MPRKPEWIINAEWQSATPTGRAAARGTTGVRK